MLEQQLDLREQPRAGEQIEKAVGFGEIGASEDAASLPRDGAAARLPLRLAAG